MSASGKAVTFKGSARLALVGLIGAGLVTMAGCASVNEFAELNAADGYVEYDRDRMAVIDRAARRNGVDVFWVNPPERRVKKDSSSN